MAIARQRIHLPPRAWRRALAAWRGGRLWEGEATARFEAAFAAAVGVEHAVAIPSGRAGLLFLLEALELEPGSEVICCAFGYPVVPYLVRERGFDLRLVDCEPRTLGMDPAALAEALSDRTKAVIATHLYGVPCRIRELSELCEARGVTLIEDCAHSLGASVGGRPTGSIGRAGYFSFETSKIVNTMGGGMLTTDDAELAERLRKCASSEPPHGTAWLRKRLTKTSFETLVTHPWVFNLAVYPALRLASSKDRFASGYAPDALTTAGRLGRYSAYQAELGLAQLGDVERRAEARRRNVHRLRERLRGQVPFQEPDAPDVVPNPMLSAALFEDMPRVARELLARGIDTKRDYMRDCSALLDQPGHFPVAVRADRQVLHLPAHPELSEQDMDRIAAAVADVL
ncbi:MAG: aminotransferase class I/II-fold pyridoxal phosphate-dependent enzyme [Deltaproteobacteria bacterium]|nr:aminotransferase class I/II-fold pyridoxal phosphate-dependent enzyme [Deltaproteobacteria bacterium]